MAKQVNHAAGIFPETNASLGTCWRFRRRRKAAHGPNRVLCFPTCHGAKPCALRAASAVRGSGRPTSEIENAHRHRCWCGYCSSEGSAGIVNRGIHGRFVCLQQMPEPVEVLQDITQLWRCLFVAQYVTERNPSRRKNSCLESRRCDRHAIKVKVVVLHTCFPGTVLNQCDWRF